MPWQRSPSIFSDLLGRCSWWNWTMASHRCPTWLLRHTEPLPLLCLCYAFAMPSCACIFDPLFILLLCLFCCFQLSLDVTHLQATAAGHCGGHGAHVDAERTANGSLWVISPPSVSSRNAGICRVFLGFSFHRSFLFFVISNERYLQICDTRT